MKKKALKDLALDIRANKVFTSWQVPQKQYLPLIFMPIALGGFKKVGYFFIRILTIKYNTQDQ